MQSPEAEHARVRTTDVGVGAALLSSELPDLPDLPDLSDLRGAWVSPAALPGLG
jgi:hypothetical protein